MSNYAFAFKDHGTFTPDGRDDSIADVNAHNAEVERAELAAWQRQPERWQVYVSDNGTVTTWLGTLLGRVVQSSTFRNNFGGRTTCLMFVGTNGARYHGRYGADWSQLCRVRKGRS